MQMNWLDLCFLHWPVRVADLRPFIPSALEVDSYDGWAWLALVPFTMTGVKPVGFPDIPGVSAFPEFNVRTYVRVRAVGGVWFFSLDAGHPLAVRVARALFHLPYFDATFERSWQRGWCHYSMRRTHRGCPGVHSKVVTVRWARFFARSRVRWRSSSPNATGFFPSIPTAACFVAAFSMSPGRCNGPK